ncbi:MAG TPA: elongation factor G [bacterium]|nr:elongation factor G [bacterium]
MKEYERTSVRTVGLFAHGGAGKTSLAEAMLFTAGAVNRLGQVVDGTSVLDFEAEEKKRVSSVSTHFCHIEYNKCVAHIVDTPGDPNFVAEAKNALNAVDIGLFVVDAVDQVKVLTEKLWKDGEGKLLARFIFVSKMDRERADYDAALTAIRNVLGVQPCPISIPIGKEAEFKGVVDLLRMKALVYAGDGSGKYNEESIPADLKNEADDARRQLVEAVAESNDALLEKYLEEKEITPQELFAALAAGVKSGTVVPVLAGSGVKNIGIKLLLDVIAETGPSPLDRKSVKGADPKGGEVERPCTEDAPFCAQVFKTISDPYKGKLAVFRIFSGKLQGDSTVINSTKQGKERIGQMLLITGENTETINPARIGDIVAVAKLKDTATGDTLSADNDVILLPPLPKASPVISFAVTPKTKGDEDKLMTSLNKIMEEDPTLGVRREEQTGEFIIEGMGQVHVETTLEKMKRKYGVEVILSAPKVPYLETIKRSAKGEGKYKKQTGGRGQYGWCWVEISPLSRDGEVEFEFEDAIKGGAIPNNYIPSVEKGVKTRMTKGVLAGYPMKYVKVRLYDGKYHEVDSSDRAFQIAGSLGFKAAAEQAGMCLLEPIMTVEVVVPNECAGDVIGDMNRRRGRLLGTDSSGNSQIIKAQVPLAEMLRYSPDLDSITSGRGMFTMEFDHYEEVPAHIAEKVIAASKKTTEEEEE